jgi:hypothetical protein
MKVLQLNLGRIWDEFGAPAAGDVGGWLEAMRTSGSATTSSSQGKRVTRWKASRHVYAVGKRGRIDKKGKGIFFEKLTWVEYFGISLYAVFLCDVYSTQCIFGTKTRRPCPVSVNLRDAGYIVC